MKSLIISFLIINREKFRGAQAVCPFYLKSYSIFYIFILNRPSVINHKKMYYNLNFSLRIKKKKNEIQNDMSSNSNLC